MFLLHERPGFINRDLLNRHRHVVIQFSLFLDYNIRYFAVNQDNLFIYLGINYMKYMPEEEHKNNWNMANQFLKAISDSSRQSIYELILNRELNPKEIGETLGLAQSTMTYHMMVLENGNILDKRFAGKWTYYSVNIEKVEQLIGILKKCLLARAKRPVQRM
ncbi:MAG TPA: hypothetical protein DD727_02245 [Clostridiales bacterium]|nr:hypothetical protein [Clostridiales bacterium]